MNIRNPVFDQNGNIICEIEHPQYGWIPFTASATDSEEHGRQIYAEALALNPGPYVPKVPTIDELIAAAKALRAAAYRSESDPLFFKCQAGEELESVWIAKRNEIRARFPYPEA